MNVRAGWALTRVAWIEWMQGRSFFFLLAFSWMIPPLIFLFVWYTAASGQAVGGLTQGEFVTYYLLFILVNQLTYAQTNWTVGDGIRDGRLSFTLLRPISPFLAPLPTELAGKAVFMIFVVPVAVLLALLLHPVLHLTHLNALAFIPTLALAWLLRFFWGYWLALLAFWATRADALLAVQDALIFLLAGQVAPIEVLPAPLQTMAKILPFRYMISFPIEVLTGQVNASDLLIGLAYQSGWLALALVLCITIWRTGLRRYTAIGG
jgi:ABC-2 type transport system permease protein